MFTWIPLPISVLTLGLVAIGTFVGVTGLLSPGGQLPAGALDHPRLELMAGQLAARNLAMAGILLAAWLTRSGRVLAFVLGMRAFTETMDLFFVLRTGVLPLPSVAVAAIWLGVFIGPEILSARYLLRRRDRQPTPATVPAI